MTDEKIQEMLDEIKTIDSIIVNLRKQRLDINNQIDGIVKSEFNIQALYDQLYDVNWKISEFRDKKADIYKKLYKMRGLDGSLIIK